jgi:hypothetical protein
MDIFSFKQSCRQTVHRNYLNRQQLRAWWTASYVGPEPLLWC